MKQLLFASLLITIATIQVYPQKIKAALARSEGLWGIIDEKGNVLIDYKFDIWHQKGIENAPYYNESKSLIFLPGDNLFKYRKHNTYGYFDLTGKVHIENQFMNAEDFTNGYAIVSSRITHGIIDKEGKYLFKPVKFEIINFSPDRILFKDGSKYGYMNFKGEICIPANFKEVTVFNDSIACVNYKGKYGYINLKGEWMIEPKYIIAFNFINKLAVVVTESGYGVINTKNEYVIKPEYERIKEQCNGYFRVQQGDLWGFIDTTGLKKISCHYSKVNDFSEGFAVVHNGENWGAINDKDETVLDFGYKDIHDCKEGIFLVEESAFLWGYYLPNGQKINSSSYQVAYDFSDGFARVYDAGFYGFLNKTGQYQIKPVFSNAYDFKQGMARVRDVDFWGFIDTSGKITITPIFNNVSDFFLIEK